MKKQSILFGLTGLVVSCSQAVKKEDSAPRRPNVLLILADDQGWGDIHSHGNKFVETPVLDSFANKGIELANFYMSPMSSPSRASLLTGRYYLRTGVRHVKFLYDNMRLNEVTLGEALHENGYKTACIGKWHNGNQYPYTPNGQGFDEFFGFYGGVMLDYFDVTLKHNNSSVQTKGYIADVLTDTALQFIERNKSNPFFCYLPYNTIHEPLQVPDTYFNKYKAKGLTDDLAALYGMCENLDDNVGRLLEKLDELGLRENTIVIYTSDNGPYADRYNGVLRGHKGCVHEGGVKVPCFIQWKGTLPEGKMIQEKADHIDIFPTILDLTGISCTNPNKLDGVSLKGLLTGKQDSIDRFLFSHMDGNGAVRTTNYRFIYEEGKPHLYNLKKDPSEEKDLSADEPAMFDSLFTAYKKWYTDVTTDGFEFIYPVVGYQGWENVEVPVYQAIMVPFGDGMYDGSHPRRGWGFEPLDKWTNPKEYVKWTVEFVEDCDYKFSLNYNCSQRNIGSQLLLQCDHQSAVTTVNKAFYSKTLISHDRVNRITSMPREWSKMDLGTLHITKGVHDIYLRCLEMKGDTVADVISVNIEKVNEKK